MLFRHGYMPAAMAASRLYHRDRCGVRRRTANNNAGMGRTRLPLGEPQNAGLAYPLYGIRVLDLGRALAAPMAAQNLADLGADVIKVERPRVGDDLRLLAPFLTGKDGHPTRESAYWLSANRSKRSIEVDIASPAGQKVIRDLVAQSDILIENYKVGDLRRYGLAYEDLAPSNPGLIYCSVTGFGQSGPSAGRGGYDPIFQAMSGLMSLTGEPGQRPQKVGAFVSDFVGGQYATSAILAALLFRERGGGRGQHIDISLFDAQISALAPQLMAYLVSGQVPPRFGNAAPSATPSDVFATADGWLFVSAWQDSRFLQLAVAIGHPGLASDPRFSGHKIRHANRETLTAELADIFAGQTTAHWTLIFEANGVMFAPLNTLDQLADDPQVAFRKIIGRVDHALAGTAPDLANPIRLSASPVAPSRAAPALGEHTESVLREELRWAEPEIAAYMSALA